MKKKLIYILGSQRSGTTALEYILSTNPNLFALGEVRLLDDFIANIPKLKVSLGRCTCGISLNECTFWSKILNRVSVDFGFSGRDLLTNVPFVEDKVSCKKHLHALFETLSDETNQVLVDSSKNLDYLDFLIGTLPDWEISVIYVTREPLEVALSVQKWHKRFDFKKQSIYEIMSKWAYANWKMVRWLRRHSNITQFELRYESFVTDPDASLLALSNALGLSNQFQRSLNLRELHTVSGTPSRFNSDEFRLSPVPMKNQIKGNFLLRFLSWAIRRLCHK